VVLLVEVVLGAAVVMVVIPYDQVVALAAVCGRVWHHSHIPSYIFALIYVGPTPRLLLFLQEFLLPGDVVSTVTFGPQVNHRMTPHVLVCVCVWASERG
jgi:hypothetical protein